VWSSAVSLEPGHRAVANVGAQGGLGLRMTAHRRKKRNKKTSEKVCALPPAQQVSS
jgi:hypothetical protein